jgi:hypothetical protein
MGNYDQYICSRLFKRENLPGPTPAQRDILASEGWRISLEHVLWIDSDVIPGSYYGESTWIWPRSYPHQIDPQVLAQRFQNAQPMFPHAHDFPEILSWWGADPEHPEDTTSMGMLLGNEEIRLDRSWVCYIPAGMKHVPTMPRERRVSSKPVCHWTAGPGVYTREGDRSEAPKTAQDDLYLRASEIKNTGKLENTKYLIYGYATGVKRPSYLPALDPEYSRPVAYIDETIVPEAEYGCDAWWLLPGNEAKAGQILMNKRTLPHGASITLTALNYEDISDLCAEAELWIGGEKHVITKSFGAYLPANVECGPLIVRNIDRQILFNLTQPVGQGINKYPGG